MTNQKFTLLLVLLVGILFTACKKDDDTTPGPDVNQEVADKFPGTWFLTKVTQNGTNITGQSSGLMTFRSDKTMDFISQDSGFVISDSGSWLIKDEGKTLELTLDSVGKVTYKINSISATDMTLEASVGPNIRMFEFKKQ